MIYGRITVQTDNEFPGGPGSYSPARPFSAQVLLLSGNVENVQQARSMQPVASTQSAPDGQYQFNVPNGCYTVFVPRGTRGNLNACNLENGGTAEVDLNVIETVC